MKRILFSIAATVAGVVALLSFKTHSPVTVSGASLPSAGLPGSSSTTGPTTGTATATGAPPDPSNAGAGSSAATPSVPASASSTPPGAASSATYTGAAENTRYGVVQVKITVAGKRITNVAFAQLTAFDDRSAQINSDAAPILLQETLDAQSAQIDVVSGASYTSQGYMQSLQSALDQAGI